MARASFVDQTKLLLLVTIFFLIILLQPILIAVKVNQNDRLQDASWLILLIPFWCFGALTLLFWSTLAFLTKSGVVIFASLECASWLAGCALLACIWDRVISVNWYIAAIPFYLGITFRILKALASTSAAHSEQDKMISPEHHHKLMQIYRDLVHRKEVGRDLEQGGTNEELDEHNDLLEKFPTEEAYIDHLQENYVVVTLNEEAYAAAVTLMEMPDTSGRTHVVTEEEKEVMRVTMSNEFVAVEEAIRELRRGIYLLIVIGVTFTTLVAYKLQSESAISWWVIFIPFWVYLGVRFVSVFFICCCGSVSSQPIILDPMENGSPDENLAEKSQTFNPRGSVPFAAPDGEMEDFNVVSAGEYSTEIKEEVSEAGVAIPAINPTSPEIRTDNDSNAEETSKSQSSTGKTAEEAERDKPFFGKDGDPSFSPEIDFEAAFHAWQSAQAQADDSMMEQQSKAAGVCCVTLLQLIILACTVGCLENRSMNALSVLSPVIAITGIILFGCACFIYRADTESINVVSEQQAQTGEENDTGLPVDLNLNETSVTKIVPPVAVDETITTAEESPGVTNELVVDQKPTVADEAGITMESSPASAEDDIVMDDLD